jgi:hypothetical protein
VRVKIRCFLFGEGSQGTPTISNPPFLCFDGRKKVNSYASTKLLADDAQPPPSSSNPFAKVLLNSATTAVSFPFGALPKTEPKPFAFASTSSTLSSSKPKGGNNAQIETINRDFFEMLQDHLKKGEMCTDLTPLMEQYINVAENLQSDDQDEDDGKDGDDGHNEDNDGDSGQNRGGTAFLGRSSSINDANKSEPSTSFSVFSFASSSAPRAPETTTTTFSFTGGSTAAPVAAAVSAPSFSFGAQPAATISGTANDDDPTFNPDDGKLEVGHEENKDEETLYEVRARLVKMIGGAWNKSCTGPCRLYRNTLTEKKRMVLRNDVGKVMLNVAVSKGMPFKKISQRTRKGEVWHVSFMAVEDESEGAKQIMLNVKKEDIDKFHEKLENMAA